MPDLIVYRGQKHWRADETLTAPSLRRATSVPDPETWTEGLLATIDQLIRDTESGDRHARKALEIQLLASQQSAAQSPYVSCTHSKSVAASFALFEETPGYLLEIIGDSDGGLDYEAIRRRFDLFGDAMDYLQEFGVPKELKEPFSISRVDLVSGYVSSQVFP